MIWQINWLTQLTIWNFRIILAGDMMIKDYAQEPTDKAKVDSSKYDAEMIGENDLGTVHLHGPFGNTDSNVRIAYLIGMHPM